jgi:hypothetical protein
MVHYLSHSQAALSGHLESFRLILLRIFKALVQSSKQAPLIRWLTSSALNV